MSIPTVFSSGTGNKWLQPADVFVISTAALFTNFINLQLSFLYNSFQLAARYARYLWKGANGKGHGIHSPFVYDFVINVLNDRRTYDAFEKIESLRSLLLKDTTPLQVEDHGAGSVLNGGNTRSISEIARHASKSRKIAQLLFRIVRYFKPQVIVEFGTSLGISAAYLSAAVPEAIVKTIEGSSAIAEKARQNLERMQCKQVEVLKGTFDTVLPGLLATLRQVDCAFIDGNHRKEPTLKYFETLLPYTHENSFLIIDDIHWSAEMEAAWDVIKDHPRVTCTIDLFFIGLIFFRKEMKTPEHFIIRYPYFY